MCEIYFAVNLPFRIIWATSTPAMVAVEKWKALKPIIGRMIRLMNQFELLRSANDSSITSLTGVDCVSGVAEIPLRDNELMAEAAHDAF